MHSIAYCPVFPRMSNMNGTVWPNCADMPLGIYSLVGLSQP